MTIHAQPIFLKHWLSGTLYQTPIAPKQCVIAADWQGQTSEASEYECSRPDASTAAAMIYCLFRQVSGVVRLQNSLRNARTQAVSKRRLSHKIHQVDATGSHAEGNDMPITDKILLANHFLGKHHTPLHHTHDVFAYGINFTACAWLLAQSLSM